MPSDFRCELCSYYKINPQKHKFASPEKLDFQNKNEVHEFLCQLTLRTKFLNRR